MRSTQSFRISITNFRVNLHAAPAEFHKFHPEEEMASGKIALSNLVPVGYRFHPTDEEIVTHFLKNKMLGNDHLVGHIAEVDVCKYEPWELPHLSVVESDDPEWFFFSVLDFKYCHGQRSNRGTKDGYWKATGKNRKIKARRTNDLIGTKKTLVFYKKRLPKDVRTNWVIHEYHSVDNYSQTTTYVVCRLKKKDDEKVEKLANEERENDNVDFDLQSRTIESAMAGVRPEENGELLLHEENRELPDIDTDDFVNSLFVDREDYYYDGEIADPYNDEFIISSWTESAQLHKATHSRDTVRKAMRPRFEDLPSSSSRISAHPSSNLEPQLAMMMIRSRDNTLRSKQLRYENQENTYRLNEFSRQDISGEDTDVKDPVWDVLLQRRIKKSAANRIKAEEASSSSSNDHLRPPSEYFANVVVGIIMFVVFIRELVLYGEWGI